MVPPVVVYQSAVRDGDRVFTSGQLPMKDGQLMTPGKLGGAVSEEEEYAAARQCALNALAATTQAHGLSCPSGDLGPVRPSSRGSTSSLTPRKRAVLTYYGYCYCYGNAADAEPRILGCVSSTASRSRHHSSGQGGE